MEKNNMKIWFIENNRVVGPITIEQLNKLYTNKIINDNTLIKSAEGDDWQLLINSIYLNDSQKNMTISKKYRSNKIKYIIASLLCVTILILIYMSFFNNEKKYDTNDIAKNTSSVLLIKTYDEEQNLTSTGSGFLITEDGLVVTNFHVINGASYIDVISDTDTVHSVEKVQAYDIGKDIAVLQVNGLKGIKSIKLGDSDLIKLGDSVVAIGSPIGLKNTVSTGNISGIRDEENTKTIQITSPISSGSSGGALFNLHNEVIGVTFASIIEGQNLNFAIPINYVKDLISVNKNLTVEALKQETKMNLGNSISNITNDGLVVESEMGTYFCIGFGETWGIYFIDKQNEIQLIYSGTCYGNLLLKDEYLYFLGDQYYLHRLEINNYNVEKMSNNSMNDISIIDNYVYYKDSYQTSTLKKMDLYSREITTITHDVYKYLLCDDGIYYVSKDNNGNGFVGDGLYRAGFNGENSKLILEIENAKRLSMFNSRIYLLLSENTSDKLYSFNINNFDTFNKISVDDIGDFAIDEDWIYYRNNSMNGYLYKMKHDGSSKQSLDKKTSWFINLTNEWIYYKIYPDSKTAVDEWDLSLLRINKSSNIKEKITPDTQ